MCGISYAGLVASAWEIGFKYVLSPYEGENILDNYAMEKLKNGKWPKL